MGQGTRFVVLLVLGYALATCSSAGYVSPNDPQYARTGAPRTGEPATPQGSGYNLIQGPDGGANAPM